MKLTRQQLDTLIRMFPEGADVVEGRREGHVHAQPIPPRTAWGITSGVLLVHDGLDGGGCAALGINREHYFRLPEHAWEAKAE